MLRFLHTADWQIGKPYGRVADPQKRFRLQEERLRVLDRLAAVVRERQLDLVLVAGDLFDSPTLPTSLVLEVLEAIGAMGCPVLAIPGNHDHGGPGSLWHRDDVRREQARLAPLFQLLLQPEPLELDQAVLLPAPLLRRRDSRDPTAWIAGLDWAGLSAAKPRLVLAHGAVHGFGPRDYDRAAPHPQAPGAGADPGGLNRLQLERLPAAEIDYIALGDWHNLRQVGPRAWYPGTPEPDRFDQGDDNQRGQVLVVAVARGEEAQVEVVPTGRLGWHNLRVHLHNDDDLARLEQDLAERLQERVGRDLLRLEISGSLSLAGHRRYDQLVQALEQRLLRLRIKGQCQQAPQAAELEALVARAGDPLIARVACELQARLERQRQPANPGTATVAGDGAWAGAVEADSALARLALCELHRLVQGQPDGALPPPPR